MNDIQSKRLADIRAQTEKLIALDRVAETWDATFMLKIIDEKNQRIRELEKGR